MSSENIYMIRGGGFGASWDIKLLLTIITIILVIYDWKVRKRLDYFWIFLTGTIIWSLVELSIQLGGTRIITERLLFGIEIPLWISIPLQGISEGSMAAVFGIFIGDRIREKETRKITIIIFIIIMVGLAANSLMGKIQLPFVGLLVPSRRDMFTLPSIIFMGIMITIDIIFLIKNKPEAKKRAVYLLFIILIFASVWTISEWLAGTRWIEVGSFPLFTRASPLIEFGALAYDVIVEITLAYIPYLVIPYWLKLIKT